jgi:hypothetical protein
MVCQIKFTEWTRDDRLRQPDYFKLEITSFSGPSWRAMVAEPNLRTGLSGPGIAYGSVHEIRREHQLPGEELGDYAFLFLPNRIDFPTNSTTQIGEFAGSSNSGFRLSRKLKFERVKEQAMVLFGLGIARQDNGAPVG